MGFEVRYNLIELCMGADIDDQDADRFEALVARAHQLATPGARLLVDGRYKSFASLRAQRRLSSGALRRDDLPRVEALAAWATPEQRAGHGDSVFAWFSQPDAPSAPPWVSQRHRAGRASVHLIAGSTGAGKSSYAARLARDLGAMCFGIDDWMQRLFGADRPRDAGFEWYMTRIERCEEQIWRLACELHDRAVPSILDLGLTTRAHRARFLEQAAQAGISARLHYVDVPAERRWQRVEARNRERGATYRLEVTRDMFDFVEGMFEPPIPDETDDFVYWWS